MKKECICCKFPQTPSRLKSSDAGRNLTVFFIYIFSLKTQREVTLATHMTVCPSNMASDG